MNALKCTCFHSIVYPQQKHTQVDLVAYQHLAHFTSYQGKILIVACGLRLLSGFGSIMRLISQFEWLEALLQTGIVILRQHFTKV